MNAGQEENTACFGSRKQVIFFPKSLDYGKPQNQPV
jgi:hypothetical protein